jgi:crotonobetainyl-CoA:carnitine CoA-transferase CaiB-like acyl-CoA transferase
VEHVEELAARLAPVLAREPADVWIERLRAAGVPAGPINDVAEAYALASSLGFPTVVQVDGRPAPAATVALGAVRRPPPRLDEHGAEIRAWLSS